MKKLLILLLLANAALFGYTFYERYNSEAQAASDRYKPFNADQVRVLTTQQISKLGPAKVAQLTLACAEWGPFSEADRTRAVKLLEPLGLARTLSTRRVDVPAEHWVYIPPKANKNAADRALADLKRLNVKDFALIQDPGEWSFAISLGMFRNKDDADARLAEVKKAGVKTATYGSRLQTVAMTNLVLREPAQSTITQLETLQKQISGTAVATGACPESK